MQLKGRHWVVLWLIAFLAVTSVVIARQTRAHVVAGELRDARERRRVLEAELAELTRAIQQASSRAVITAKAAALGLRPATSGEITILSVPDVPTGDH